MNKIKKFFSGGERKIQKQEKPKQTRQQIRQNRAPNFSKQRAESAYRAKRQAQNGQNKAVSSMSRGAKQTFKTNTQKSPVQRFNAGAIKSGALMGIPSDKGVPQTVKASTSYKAGKVVGTAASYLGGYGGVGKGIAKQAVKQTVKRNVAKEVTKKAVRTNTGKLATKDFLKTKPIDVVKETKLPTVTKKTLAKTTAKTAEKPSVKAAVKNAIKSEPAKETVKATKFGHVRTTKAYCAEQ